VLKQFEHVTVNCSRVGVHTARITLCILIPEMNKVLQEDKAINLHDLSVGPRHAGRFFRKFVHVVLLAVA